MAGERPAARDRALMRRALVNAAKGWGHTAPNPMVGAVVVSDDRVVAEGWHREFGGAHAEVEALAAAGDRAKGGEMFVTLEPCTHHGKTPPCTDAIIAAGISRVVVGSRDPNRVAAGGVETLRNAGIDVDVRIDRDACELNAPFFNSFASDLPWVTLKLAMSADGGIADPTGQRRWITGTDSRREVHQMRAGADAVAVGIGTVLADDPDLTVRDVPLPRLQGTRVIFDSHLRIPLTSHVVRTAWKTPTIVIARRSDQAAAAALTERGVSVLVAPDLREALLELRRRELRSILVEGGAKLAGAFLTEKLVDRLAIFQSPVELGSGALKGFAHAPPGIDRWLESLLVVERRTFGEDTLTTYAVREVPCSPA